MEKTLVIIKPDGVKRGLIGEIISRYERKGFKILDAKLIRADRKILEEHYSEHKGKDYFEKLVAYMMEGPVMVMIIEGEDVVEVIRNMNGHKDPKKALPGTIRGDYANSVTKNIVHASDSMESAEREINIWF